MYEDIVKSRKNDPSSGFKVKEQDEIGRLFVTYLSYRAALLRMVAYYQGFEGASDPQQRARCFLLGYTAGTTIFSISLSLVEKYRDEKFVRKKLNEAVPKWSIKKGMFDKIVVSIASKQNSELFEEMAAYLSKESNGLADFFLLYPGNTLRVDTRYFDGKSKTFTKAAGGPFDTNVTCLQSGSLPGGHELRIYETT